MRDTAGTNMITCRVQKRAQDRENHLLVWASGDVGKGPGSLQRQDTRRQVHALTCQSQEQPQDFTPVALVFFGSRNRCRTAHAALPYRIADFGTPMWLSWYRKVGEEQQIDKGVDKLLG